MYRIYKLFACVVGKRESLLKGLRKSSREGGCDICQTAGSFVPAASVTLVTMCHAAAIRAIYYPRAHIFAMSSFTSDNTPVDIMDIDDVTKSEASS